MRINLQDFFEEKHLRFKSERQGLNWVKRNLKPASVLRIGPNYLVDQKEIEKLFNEYVKDQEKLSKKRSKIAGKLNSKPINKLQNQKIRG